MYKLEPVYIDNTYLINEAMLLLIRCGGMIFPPTENPAAVFLDGIKNGDTRAIAAILDDKVIGIVAFYDFHYLSEAQFICYMYGGAQRGVAKYLELGFTEIFKSLKSQGCLAIRFETKKCNLPMRFMARRLGFRKVGEFCCGSVSDKKICENLLYEKVL